MAANWYVQKGENAFRIYIDNYDNYEYLETNIFSLFSVNFGYTARIHWLIERGCWGVLTMGSIHRGFLKGIFRRIPRGILKGILRGILQGILIEFQHNSQTYSQGICWKAASRSESIHSSMFLLIGQAPSIDHFFSFWFFFFTTFFSPWDWGWPL